MSESMSLDPRKLASELVGTFVLVFVAAGAIVASSQDIVAVALASGLAGEDEQVAVVPASCDRAVAKRRIVLA